MAECAYPITIKNPIKVPRKGDFSHIPVPCGKCIMCRRNRINQWLFRLLEHQKSTLTSHFVTFTYGDNDKPGFIESPNGLNTLRPVDLQLYWKRLRKENPHKISYFACGEYGTKRQRPHYHAIIFNSSPDLITKHWTHGHVHIDEVNQATIQYTLKYMQKPKTIPQFQLDDRVPEFQVFSKGLGAAYLSPQIIKYHQADYLNRRHVTLEGGIKSVMPKSFLPKIFTPSQLAAQREHIVKLRMQDDQIINERDRAESLKALSTYNLDPERNSQF